MKRLTFLLIFIPTILFGQQFNKIISATDTFYVLTSLDTSIIPKGLPDGKWKVFFENDTSRPEYIFYLQNNKVNGFFMSYNLRGDWATIGSYQDDSLWTFRTDKFGGNDTTFKIGSWNYQASGYVKGHLYKIPFNSKDSIYTDNWYYKNGRLLSESIYHKSKGLIKETWFYENGDKSSLFEKHTNYSTKTEWTKEQKISNFNLEQQLGFSIQLDTNNIRFNRCKDCIIQTIYDPKDIYVSTIWIDSKGRVRGFSSGGVTLTYDNEGTVKDIEYWNKKKKWRLKKLK